MSVAVHINEHIGPISLFRVDDPPEDMLERVGRRVYKRCADPQCYPVTLPSGELVMPHWKDTGRVIHSEECSILEQVPTTVPRVYLIGGLQKDYTGRICYRLYATEMNDQYGVPARPEEVVFAG